MPLYLIKLKNDRIKNWMFFKKEMSSWNSWPSSTWKVLSPNLSQMGGGGGGVLFWFPLSMVLVGIMRCSFIDLDVLILVISSLNFVLAFLNLLLNNFLCWGNRHAWAGGCGKITYWWATSQWLYGLIRKYVTSFFRTSSCRLPLLWFMALITKTRIDNHIKLSLKLLTFFKNDILTPPYNSLNELNS